MNKYLVLCTVSIILVFVIIYMMDQNKEGEQLVLLTKQDHMIPPLFRAETDSIHRTIANNCIKPCSDEFDLNSSHVNININQIKGNAHEESDDITLNIDDIDEIDDIFVSEKQQDLAMSETTNNMIENSFKNIMDKIYKKVVLMLNIHHLNKDFEFKFEIDVQKDIELTNNFLQLLRVYNGCTIYDFNKKYGILYTGDYLNNSGITNLNINRVQQLIKQADIPSFIPAYSICMVGIKNKENMFVGSNFILNLSDIEDKQFINDNALLPFGKFNISDDADKMITTYFLNSADQIRKPRIKVIYELDRGSLLA